MISRVPPFAFAYGEPRAAAVFRRQPEDFFVDEELGFEPTGEGEHIYLRIEKRAQNTPWVAKQLAGIAGIPGRDVGYCGLKDRHAVTRQWFSLYCPRAVNVDWSQLVIPGVSVIAAARHPRKLRPGDHTANHFVIRLRAVDVGDEWQARLGLVATGVPNYFGEQRFGIDGNNLALAEQLLIQRRSISDNKKLRGFAISAARSLLFNLVLSHRVESNNWRELLDGESGDHATGPLWGRGRSLVGGELLALESTALSNWRAWCNGLEHVGLKQERRPLCCMPQGFSARADGADWVIAFRLPPGQFATAVLREIAQLNDVSGRNSQQCAGNAVL